MKRVEMGTLGHNPGTVALVSRSLAERVSHDFGVLGAAPTDLGSGDSGMGSRTLATRFSARRDIDYARQPIPEKFHLRLNCERNQVPLQRPQQR